MKIILVWLSIDLTSAKYILTQRINALYMVYKEYSVTIGDQTNELSETSNNYFFDQPNKKRTCLRLNVKKLTITFKNITKTLKLQSANFEMSLKAASKTFMLLGKCIPCVKQNASKFIVKRLELDTNLNMVSKVGIQLCLTKPLANGIRASSTNTNPMKEENFIFFSGLISQIPHV